MDAYERTAIRTALRRVAIGDCAYVLRAYTVARVGEIAEAIGVPERWLIQYTNSTPDDIIREKFLALCSEPAPSGATEWSECT